MNEKRSFGFFQGFFFVINKFVTNQDINIAV